jgi:hypothetical protein
VQLLFRQNNQCLVKTNRPDKKAPKTGGTGENHPAELERSDLTPGICPPGTPVSYLRFY